MHILLVTGEYPPMQGGVGAYTAALGQTLAGQGLAVSVITHRRGTSLSPIPPLSPDYPRTYPQISRWDWRSLGRIATLADELAADWVHVQYQTAAFGMHPAINFGPLFWRRRGFRVAWTYHDLLVPYLFPKAGARLRRWVTERPAFSADATIVTNEQDRLALVGRVANLSAIPIGSNIRGVTLRAGERQGERARLGYGADDLVMAYFGFLNRSKGGITLIESLHRLVTQGRNAHLLMIGERVGASDPTNFAYLQEVEARIGALGLSPRVQWTGRLDDDGVAASLNAIDVLVMPYSDGASLRRGTLMAGLANGCAIVTTTPQTPLAELRDGEEWLTVPPGDGDATAQAVARIADDCQLAGSLRANARAASRLYAWENIAARHLSIYGQSSGLADPRLLPDNRL
ncbi:MAG: glycosyltransferase family 4 protein [Caldilineaceae bacterium]|nr:glycosyltransferase family 4 protein [Caldilineaceae bacterium]